LWQLVLVLVVLVLAVAWRQLPVPAADRAAAAHPVRRLVR
jgi:hypothetical protein